MANCKYCDKDFSGKKEKLEHELDEHNNEMSGHEKSDKKSKLNKIQQQTQTSKHNKRKNLEYGLIGIIVLGLVGGGGYYASQTLDFSRNIDESNGVGTPVHWHADYQITVCGEEQVLRGGPTEAHTHGQTTFHLEGVRNSQEQTQLDWIVDSLGGELEENSIMGRASCNGETANLTVEANGEEIEDHLNYIPRDGDFIRIDYS